MIEIRRAKKGELEAQKEIWKLCFVNDSIDDIENFYNYRFREEETMLLLDNGVIAAMLTMFPVKMMAGDAGDQEKDSNATMLYAVATHPRYQKRGFATRLMDFTHQYLKEKNNMCSVLAPEEEHLFGFYRHLGYEDGFYIREILLTRDMMEKNIADNTEACSIQEIDPKEYNQIRNNQLRGKQYIAYADEDIFYQKKISKQTGGDIYRLKIGATVGCAAIDRLGLNKVIIKEILISDRFLMVAVEKIMNLHQAQEYIVRTPLFLGANLTGAVRANGMIKATGDKKLNPLAGNLKEAAISGAAYLGLAFD